MELRTEEACEGVLAMRDDDLISWIDLCLAAIGEFGSDIRHVDLHREERFTAREREWDLTIRYPWGEPHRIRFDQDPPGKWHRHEALAAVG
jgi:hypothetical protein